MPSRGSKKGSWHKARTPGTAASLCIHHSGGHCLSVCRADIIYDAVFCHHGNGDLGQKLMKDFHKSINGGFRHSRHNMSRSEFFLKTHCPKRFGIIKIDGHFCLHVARCLPQILQLLTVGIEPRRSRLYTQYMQWNRPLFCNPLPCFNQSVTIALACNTNQNRSSAVHECTSFLPVSFRMPVGNRAIQTCLFSFPVYLSIVKFPLGMVTFGVYFMNKLLRIHPNGQLASNLISTPLHQLKRTSPKRRGLFISYIVYHEINNISSNILVIFMNIF